MFTTYQLVQGFAGPSTVCQRETKPKRCKIFLVKSQKQDRGSWNTRFILFWAYYLYEEYPGIKLGRDSSTRKIGDGNQGWADHCEKDLKNHKWKKWMIHDDVVMVCYGFIWWYIIYVLMVYSTHISLYIVLGIEFGSFNLGLTFASLSCSRTGIHLRRSKRCVFHGFWWSTRTIRFTRIAIENGRLSSLIYLLKLVIFHICLSLPEGIPLFSHKCW